MFILIIVQKWPQISFLQSHQNCTQGRLQMIVDLEIKGESGDFEHCFNEKERLPRHPRTGTSLSVVTEKVMTRPQAHVRQDTFPARLSLCK